MIIFSEIQLVDGQKSHSKHNFKPASIPKISGEIIIDYL